MQLVQESVARSSLCFCVYVCMYVCVSRVCRAVCVCVCVCVGGAGGGGAPGVLSVDELERFWIETKSLEEEEDSCRGSGRTSQAVRL
jgi:hypothetical protein